MPDQNQPIEIFNLAVLRAAIEQVSLSTYFGSLGALKQWVASTQALGLIGSGNQPTAKGQLIADQLELTKQPAGRAYLWPHSDRLTAKATALSESLAHQPRQKVFFHGSPNKIEQFQYEHCSKSEDYMGSGFYFTSNAHDALHYALADPKVAVPHEPTIIVAKLNIKHAHDCLSDLKIPDNQVRLLVTNAPYFESFLRDNFDVEFMGVEAAKQEALALFTHEEPVDVRRYLNSLANDLYGNAHIEAFNRNVAEFLGIDAMTQTFTSSTHVCAYFPEQIEIIERIPTDDINEWIEANIDQWEFDYFPDRIVNRHSSPTQK